MAHLNVQLPTGVKTQQSSNLVEDTSLVLKSPFGRRVTIERAFQPLAKMRAVFIDDTVDTYDLYELVQVIRAAHSIDVRNWSDWTTVRAQHGAATGFAATDTKLLNETVAIASRNGVIEFQGDGSTTQFSLVKTYTLGGILRWKRIFRPIAATFVTSVTGPTLDSTIGKVTASVAPGNGIDVTWGGTFWTPAALALESSTLSQEELLGFDAAVTEFAFEEVLLE